ncbi:hypothetical protein XA68_11171 [Ophiocordyceps unilateralis]|uniref:Cytochrome P450 n=1 Tax=Ophiocordyceps unilateralis TaxID=268505 RepID=A0A2A9PG22_OPHUN|nr:hypothetical protein XA68_11171 [Ophiocordyceps unilateralis]
MGFVFGLLVVGVVLVVYSDGKGAGTVDFEVDGSRFDISLASRTTMPICAPSTQPIWYVITFLIVIIIIIIIIIFDPPIELSSLTYTLPPHPGPIVRVAPNEIDVCNPKTVKSIYGTRETFRKTDWYQDFTTKGVETVFNTVDVGVHRRLRRLLAGPISDISLRAYHDRIDHWARRAVEKIRREMVDRGAADVLKWFYFMATDILGDVTFGQSPGMLERGQKDEHSQYLENAMRLSAWRSAFPRLTAVASILPLPLFSDAQKSTRELTRFATRGLARRKSLVDDGTPPETIFRNLYQAQDRNEMSANEVRNEAELYFIAGGETTANTLTFLVWAVCRHAKVQATLLSELRTLPVDGFDDSLVRRLPYLDQVVHETLRLYGAAPSGLPRHVPAGGVELDGYWLAEGTTVCAQAYTLHRDPDIFADPNKFDPARWEEPSKAMRDAFMPFGKGTRSCLGIHLAMAELRMATARFFLAFPDARVSSLEGMSDDDMGEQNYFVMAPQGQRCLIEAASVVSEKSREDLVKDNL